MKTTFDSLIFDLDGTLWDSTATVAKGWQLAKEEVNYIQDDITAEMVRSICGMTYDAIYDKLFPYLDTKQREDFKERCRHKELEAVRREGGTLYESLAETLRYLHSKYKLFIISNCQNGYIEAFLDYHQMHAYFEDHQCYGTKGQPKAYNIKDLVERNKLKAPVYIGDTQGDFDASREAGVPFLFVSYGFGQVEQGQMASVSSLAALKDIF
jgi:phosphoglycolate phosphatase